MAGPPSANMREYTPLMSTAPEDSTDEGIESQEHMKEDSTRYPRLFSALVALVAICAAAAFHLSVLSGPELLFTPQEIESSLRMAIPSPNLEKASDLLIERKMKFPRMIFPKYITRANAAAPDTVYQSGPHVVLSPSDSMIYHWKTKSSWQMCYLTGWVSSTAELMAGNKSYSSDGDLTAIEIWNLTAPADPDTLKTMSWNTRPKRVSLLGTVNFTSIETQRRDLELDGQELRAPTPRFHCLGNMQITVEVVCTTCRLEFDQVFSNPPLGFEFMQLG